MARDSYVAREADEDGEHVGISTGHSDIRLFHRALTDHSLLYIGRSTNREVFPPIAPRSDARRDSA